LGSPRAERRGLFPHLKERICARYPYIALGTTRDGDSTQRSAACRAFVFADSYPLGEVTQPKQQIAFFTVAIHSPDLLGLYPGMPARDARTQLQKHSANVNVTSDSPPNPLNLIIPDPMADTGLAGCMENNFVNYVTSGPAQSTRQSGSQQGEILKAGAQPQYAQRIRAYTVRPFMPNGDWLGNV
jgi:hypothetical protein